MNDVTVTVEFPSKQVTATDLASLCTGLVQACGITPTHADRRSIDRAAERAFTWYDNLRPVHIRFLDDWQVSVSPSSTELYVSGRAPDAAWSPQALRNFEERVTGHFQLRYLLDGKAQDSSNADSRK